MTNASSTNSKTNSLLSSFPRRHFSIIVIFLFCSQCFFFSFFIASPHQVLAMPSVKGKTSKSEPDQGGSDRIAAAKIITFKAGNETSKKQQLSPLYDPTKKGSYLEQCFTDHSKIGGGMFGKVLKAKSRDDGRWYAVKEVHNLDELPEPLRFREVEAWERATPHPTVNTLYKSWLEEGVLYMESTLCEQDLAQYQSQVKQIPEEIAWCVLSDLLQALEHIHSQGLVFVDLKQANVLLCDDDATGVTLHGHSRLKFKLSDFGLAHDMKKDDAEASRWICDVMGNGWFWRYLPDAKKQCKLSPAVDIGSLGLMTLGQVLGDNGYVQFERQNATLEQIREQLKSGTFTKVLSREMADLLAKMIDPEPGKRPTARELLAIDPLKRWTSKCQHLINGNNNAKIIENSDGENKNTKQDGKESNKSKNKTVVEEKSKPQKEFRN